MIILVVIGFILLGLLKIPNLVSKGWWRELVLFSVLWSAGLVLSILMTMGIKIPPITTIIGQSISGMLGI
ncbi:MAG: hypothetical protein ACM3NT_00430 [Methylocystaceae bacterium]